MNKKFPCPACDSVMQGVRIASHYEAPIFVDQCPKCGGIWFEDIELFRARHGEAEKLEPLDEFKLCTPSPAIEKEQLCPEDRSKLKPFRDLNFPKSIDIEHCIKCGGFFMNRCEFSAFQEHRKVIVASKPDAEEEKLMKNVERMLETQSNSKDYEALGALGKFLSQPVQHPQVRGMAWAEMNRPAPQRLLEGLITTLTALLEIIITRKK